MPGDQLAGIYFDRATAEVNAHRAQNATAPTHRRRREMKRTFYVATAFQNRQAAKKLADYLESRGMRWAFGHDWTVDSMQDPNAPETPILAQRDLQAAIEADLFILLLYDPLTPGCHGELGARVSHNREAHIVRGDVEKVHLFHKHPCVVEHSNVEDLVRYVFAA